MPSTGGHLRLVVEGAHHSREDLDGYAKDLHERVDTFLYGRRVWDMMSAYWPSA